MRLSLLEDHCVSGPGLNGLLAFGPLWGSDAIRRADATLTTASPSPHHGSHHGTQPIHKITPGQAPQSQPGLAQHASPCNANLINELNYNLLAFKYRLKLVILPERLSTFLLRFL